MIVHSQLKFNLELKNLKFLWYSLGVKSWCFSCDKMDWTYKFCAVMNVVTICILCFFRCAQRDITEWTLVHMLLIKIIWFTQYLCLVDFVSLQFRATAGTGAILAEKDTRCSAFIDVSLESRIMKKLKLTQSTSIHFKHNPIFSIVRQNWNNWKSDIRISLL